MRMTSQVAWVECPHVNVGRERDVLSTERVRRTRCWRCWVETTILVVW